MRIKHLIYAEFRFLLRYGIIPLYGILTVVYLFLLAAIPESARESTAVILVLTDPAAMGLFFMGAVVLLEKSQRVDSSLSVSPIKISEYIIAKVIPLMLVGTAVAAVLCLFAGMKSMFLVLLGVSFSSILFSLCGLIVGVNIKSLNSFTIATVPFEIILCVPSLLYFFGVLTSKLWLLHPGVAAVILIRGNQNLSGIALLTLILWCVPAFFLCKKAVHKSFCKMEGAKL